MNNKKFITAVISVAMAATFATATFAGCQKEEHAYRWTVDKEATCVAEGSRTGVCGICGGVVTEAIPVNPDNHGYGEWAVDAPTETTTGKAVKTCEYDNSHTLTVELPAITAEGTGYKSNEITRQPTSISEGARTFVFEHEVEDVKFDVAIPKRGLETVEDAVYIGWSNANKVRRSTGKYTEGKTVVSGATYYDFSCEYGENYAHIVDEGNRSEHWYSLDAAGNPFGVTKDMNNRTSVDLQVTEGNIKGIAYRSGGGSFTTYGAEDTLYTYYRIARQSEDKGSAVHFTENLYPESGGKRVGEFSYSYYENPNFCRYDIEFTLDVKTGVIVSLVVDTMVIRPYMIAEDAEGGKLFDKDGDIIFAEEYIACNALPSNDPYYAASTDPAYERDEKGNIIMDGVKTDPNGEVLHDKNGNEIPRPKPHGKTDRTYYSDDHKEVSVREVIFNAPTLKADGDAAPVNPYDSEKCYVRSFDVTYNNKVIGEEAVTIPSNKSVTFNLKNVQPETALLDYDPIDLYVRTDEGDKPLTMNFGDNAYNIIGYYNTARGNVEINARYAGEVTLVLKSHAGYAEKTVKLNIEKGAPTKIFGQAYSYSDAGGKESYSWKGYDNENGLDIYVNSPILLRGVAGDGEEKYADTTVEASCLNSDTALPDPNIHFTTVEKDGEKVVQAVADKPGVYHVYLESVKNSSVYTSIKITVADMTASKLAQTLSGEYEARLSYIEHGGTIRAAELKITFSFGSNFRSGNIVVDFEGNKLNFTYRYDDKTNTLTSERKSGDGGLNGDTFDFVFAMNSAYKLTLEHSTPFDFKEKVVLSRPQSA